MCFSLSTVVVFITNFHKILADTKIKHNVIFRLLLKFERLSLVDFYWNYYCFSSLVWHSRRSFRYCYRASLWFWWWSCSFSCFLTCFCFYYCYGSMGVVWRQRPKLCPSILTRHVRLLNGVFHGLAIVSVATVAYGQGRSWTISESYCWIHLALFSGTNTHPHSHRSHGRALRSRGDQMIGTLKEIHKFPKFLT